MTLGQWFSWCKMNRFVNGFTPDRLVFRLVSFFLSFCVCWCNLFRSSSISIQAGQISCWQFPKKKGLVCYLIWYTFSMYLCLSIIAKMSWFAKGLLRCSFWCKVLTSNSSYLISNHEIFRRCTHVSKDTWFKKIKRMVTKFLGQVRKISIVIIQLYDEIGRASCRERVFGRV